MGNIFHPSLSLCLFSSLYFFTISACLPLVVHFTSSPPSAGSTAFAQSPRVYAQGWIYLHVCERLGVCLCLCLLVLRVCSSCIYPCVFLYLPRLGIKCQSCRSMLSVIECHSRNESIAVHRGNRKTHLKEKRWILSSEGMWVFLTSWGACWMFIVHIQHRMRFYESTSAVKGSRLNASFFDTYWGHTLVM